MARSSWGRCLGSAHEPYITSSSLLTHESLQQDLGTNSPKCCQKLLFWRWVLSIHKICFLLHTREHLLHREAQLRYRKSLYHPLHVHISCSVEGDHITTLASWGRHREGWVSAFCFCSLWQRLGKSLSGLDVSHPSTLVPDLVSRVLGKRALGKIYSYQRK